MHSKNILIKDATDTEVIQAAKVAMCDEFIAKLPQGYLTMINENGSTLSGCGQQRISIAHALLKDTPVIFLDEATASLDAENETETENPNLIDCQRLMVLNMQIRLLFSPAPSFIKISVLYQSKIIRRFRHSGTSSTFMARR